MLSLLCVALFYCLFVLCLIPTVNWPNITYRDFQKLKWRYNLLISLFTPSNATSLLSNSVAVEIPDGATPPLQLHEYKYIT